MPKACYDKNGGLSVDNVPCDDNAEHSACCGFGSTCINNLYCLIEGGYKVSGTCTDQSWGASGYLNPVCPCVRRM